MAAPEWVNFSPILSLAAEGPAVPLDAAGSGSADALDLVRSGFGGVGGQVLAAAGVLVGACSRFFDPVVLAQLDSALAFELAGRARVRAVEATALVQDALRDGRSMESVAGLAQHAGASKAAETKAHKLAVAASGVLSALGGTVEPGAGFDPAVVDQVDGAALVEVIGAAEAAKNALCAVQAQAETLLMAQQRLTQARAGIPREKLGQGVGAQIGLARGESPHRGRQLCELAAVLVREMPHTLHALTVGALNEYRATIMARETVFLSLEDRTRVDELLCSDPQHAAGMGNRELGATARSAAYTLEPEAFVRRLEKAESERYVSLRPAADGMTLLTALLPLRQGVRILATLTKVAESAKAVGAERGKGQLMADTLIHRLTHHTPCTNEPGTCTTVDEPNIVLELVMTDRALFDGANDPALMVGYDPIPAPTARNWILGTTTGDAAGPTTASGTPGYGPGHGGQSSPRVWLKRLFTHPESNALLAMDSRARLFPEGMKEFLRIQDQRCRTPLCDAPIRQYDHIKAYAAGGPTNINNGQGLCTACNQAKEAPGWVFERDTVPGDSLVSTQSTTPTGHSYVSMAPPLPGSTHRPRRC